MNEHEHADASAAERIRARLERREQRERQGLRRYRPGPGSGWGLYSPSTGGRRPAPEEVLDPQIEAIRRVLAERGPTERAELARAVGARFWGPGVLRAALRIAIAGGEVRRLGRNLFSLPDDL